jgi:hypothetical protein
MSFLDLFLIFSLYTIGFYHIVVGMVGVITGSALVYPIPFTLNRMSLYLMVVWLLFLNRAEAVLSPLITHIISLTLLADLMFETIRPLITPVAIVIGTSPDRINTALREALVRLSIPFKEKGSHYILLDPFAKLKVRFRKRLGMTEVRIIPYRQRGLLEEITILVARNLDSEEEKTRKAPLGYVEFLITGVILMAVAFWRLSSLLP